MPDEKDQHGDGDRPARSLRSKSPIVAAVLGVLLGALCAQLPADYQKPCDMVSRILPGACSVQTGGEQ